MPQPFVLIPAAGTDPVDEWVRLAAEAHMANNLPKAEGFYRRALAVAPCHPTAVHNLAILYAQAGNLNEALLAVERAALFDGVEPLIAANRALLCLEADRLDEAKAAADQALALAPARPPDPAADPLGAARYQAARLAFAMVSAAAGEPARALPAYREMLELDPTNGAAGCNSCFVQSLMNVGPADLMAQRRQWYQANRFAGKVFPHLNDRDPDRTLRVGYVGGDFKSHSAAMMFANVILNHDRRQVEPYFYSSLPVNPKRDDMSQKFLKAAVEGEIDFGAFEDAAGNLMPQPDKVGRWRNVLGKTDEHVADWVREDRIDILVDLAAHTNGGRLGVFTRKPAPVQVTAWGFAHGTGVPEIDYFFADPVAVPAHERQFYAEKIFDLPCVVTYRPPVEYGIPPTSDLPYWRNRRRVTFGSFSRFEKLSDECLAVFAEILKRVPDSRLYLKDHAYKRPYSIRRVLDALGVDRGRVLFGGSTAHPEHIREYQTVDLCLDPMPHGGGIVSLETLYAGVPLLTLYGPQPSGRTASSVLTAIGRKDWIAVTPEEYVQKAVDLAGRPDELEKARGTLREELLTSPVVAGYPAAVEAAYRTIWKEWCAK